MNPSFTLPMAASRRARALLTACIVCLLAACGGGGSGDDGPPDPDGNAATVMIHGGATLAIGGDVTVKGASGRFRDAELVPGGKYIGSLEDAGVPYAIGVKDFHVGTGDIVYLVTIATQRGAVNLTPLTTLAVAQLTALDPQRYYPGLGRDDAVLKAITAPAIAAAQVEVKRYLRQRYAFTVPAAAGDFFTAPFSAVPGDPMFDVIEALDRRLAERGTDVATAARELARNAAVCKTERVTYQLGADQNDFCPAQKSALPDPDDATIVNYRFATIAGVVLTVAGRGNQVLSATLDEGPGRRSQCLGAACSGIELGTPAGNASRPIKFTAARLVGTAGTTSITGTLQSSVPGYTFPTLPCTENRYFIVNPDQRVDGACAAPDPVAGVGVGSVETSGATRRIYTFRSDGRADPGAAALEVRTDGTQVVSVLVQDVDAATGTVRTLFNCRGSACTGVSIGAARDDDDAAEPDIIRRRLIKLDGTVLAALNPDGTPSSSSGPMRVSGSVDTLEYILRPERVLRTAPCLSSSQRLTATFSDATTQPIDVCRPATLPQGVELGQILKTTARQPSGSSFLIASLYKQADDTYAVPSGDDGGVRIDVSGDNTVVEASFTPFGARKLRFRCAGEACAGIGVGAPNAAGERAVVVSGTVLRELESSGLAGDRTVTLDGRFVAPKP